eukprot:scaffold12477_cov119-Isochrysis_galbana.AAC.2
MVRRPPDSQTAARQQTTECTCVVSGPTSMPNNWQRPAILSASDISREEPGREGRGGAVYFKS